MLLVIEGGDGPGPSCSWACVGNDVSMTRWLALRLPSLDTLELSPGNEGVCAPQKLLLFAEDEPYLAINLTSLPPCLGSTSWWPPAITWMLLIAGKHPLARS